MEYRNEFDEKVVLKISFEIKIVLTNFPFYIKHSKEIYEKERTSDSLNEGLPMAR